MSEVRGGLRYTEDHEWVEVDGENGRIGVTDHVQTELGDILYAEVPEVGRKVKKGEVIGAVESMKTVADVYSPVTGEIVKVNPELEDSPQFINEGPYDQGWFTIIRIEDDSELEALMDADAYREFLEG